MGVSKLDTPFQICIKLTTDNSGTHFTKFLQAGLAMSSKTIWKTLAKFNLCPVQGSSSSTDSVTPLSRRAQLTEAKLGRKRYLCLDIRYWQNEKPLGGVNLNPEEVTFLKESICRQTTNHRSENGKSLSLLMEPQPMVLQVKADKVNAVLLEGEVMTRLQNLLPIVAWMILLKQETHEELTMDMLQTITAIKFLEANEGLNGEDDDKQITSFIESEKSSIGKMFLKLTDFFGLTEAAMNKAFEAAYNDQDADEVKALILDSTKIEREEGEVTPEGDVVMLKTLLLSLEDYKTSGKRQKLSGGSPAKRTKT